VHWRFYDAELSVEFFSLVESLKEMSRRWKGPSATSTTLHGDHPRQVLDLAGQYAAQLEQFHAAFLQHPGHCMNVLGYSRDPAFESVDCLLPNIKSRRSRGSRAHATNEFNWTPGSESGPRFGAAESSRARMPETMNTPALHASAHLWDSAGYLAPNTGHAANATRLSAGFDSNSVEDELTAMSNVLLGQQFLEMDRVITFNDTNFAIDLDGWPRMG